MEKKLNRIITFIILFIIILIFSGCSNNKKKEEEILKEKTIQELEYLDTQIISMLNKLNNINFENYEVTSRKITLENNSGDETKETEKKELSIENPEDKSEVSSDTINVTQMEPDTILVTDNNIDWKTLKSEIELLNSSWSIIILDLYSLEVNRDEILDFSKVLDKCILSIKDENKMGSLTNLAELYEFIPLYVSSIPNEDSRKNVKQTKSYIINSYVLVEQNNWTDIGKNVQEADNAFKVIMSDIEYIKTKEYKINQNYVLLKELQQSISMRDSEIFYIKYKNLMEGLNTM